MAGAERVIVDCHVHLRGPEGLDGLVRNAEAAGLARMNLVCTYHDREVGRSPGGLLAKARHPDFFYVFPGLDHAAHFSGGEVETPSLAEQAERLAALGADGIKLIETKPTHRAMVDLPIDGDYYVDFFARVEELSLPLLWHVADPEEFWDPATTPRWAAERGWGYDESFIAKETLYAEVGRVLARHPGLKIIFPHFYFLSADLERAAALLDAHPGVHLDLAPGIELLYNLSRRPEAAREFFVRHAERIIFGTDIDSEQTGPEARARAGIVQRFLETGDVFREPPEADFLLGGPEGGEIRGLSLPGEALEAIYHRNFERIAGARPRPLDRAAARAECERMARETDALAGGSAEDNPAARVAEMLAG